MFPYHWHLGNEQESNCVINVKNGLSSESTAQEWVTENCTLNRNWLSLPLLARDLIMTEYYILTISQIPNQ